MLVLVLQFVNDGFVFELVGTFGFGLERVLGFEIGDDVVEPGDFGGLNAGLLLVGFVGFLEVLDGGLELFDGVGEVLGLAGGFV